MSIKVTENAVRELVRNLLEQDITPGPVDGAAMSQLPIEADPVIDQEDLGPPVQDRNYAPENHDELMVAVEKLLTDIPEDLIPVAFKAIRKLVDKALKIAKSRAEMNPQDIVSEGVNILPLLEAIIEQVMPYTVDLDAAQGLGYDDPDLQRVKMKGEEEDEDEEDEPSDSEVEKPKAPQPPGRKIYAVVPPKSTAKSYSGQVDNEEEEEKPDADLAAMMGDQPRVTKAQREKSRKEKEVQAKHSAEQSRVAIELTMKSDEQKVQIAKKMFAGDKELAAKIDALEDNRMLDTLLTTDQVIDVEEEFIKSDLGKELESLPTLTYKEMPESLRGKYAPIMLDVGKSISNSAFRNIRDAGFMKFLAGIAMGPEKFQEELISITQDAPQDAKPIQKFLVGSLPWSSEFKKEVKKLGKMPELDADAAADVLNYMRQSSESKEGENLLDDYTSLVHYYLAVKNDFPGAEKSMRKFHFNKENGKNALRQAVQGLEARGDKKGYDQLVRILSTDENRKELKKQLGKDFAIPRYQEPQEG